MAIPQLLDTLTRLTDATLKGNPGFSGTGTVTSVGLSAPAEFTVGGSPIIAAGTLALAKANQNENLVYAGPATAPAAQPTFRALATADMPAGTGTVTSVALTMPAELSVAGSPITTSGTLAVTLANQAARTVLVGPTSGAAAPPTFRLLASADIPDNASNTTGTSSNVTDTVTIAHGGTGQVTQAAAMNALSPLTTKGDVMVHNGTDTVRLGVGTDGFAIIADSTQATGLKYAAGGTGTVTSAGITVVGGTGLLVGGSPITSAGNINLSWSNRIANTFLAGPTSGPDVPPTWRLLAFADFSPTIATSINTASTLVTRDGSGNFAAGVITAALTGNVTGNASGSSGSCTGNAATASDGLTSASGTAPLALNLAAKALTGSISVTPANPGGAVALQATSPGTVQTGNLNLSGKLLTQGYPSPYTIFTQTNSVTTTANSLTTILGTGVGTLTLPANALAVGTTIVIKAGGYVNAATTAGTHTVSILLGGSTVATLASPGTITSVVNTGWTFIGAITCRTTGAPGTVIGSGMWQTLASTSGTFSVGPYATGTTAATTTGTLTLDVQVNNGQAVGTYTTTWATVEILN